MFGVLLTLLGFLCGVGSCCLTCLVNPPLHTCGLISKAIDFIPWVNSVLCYLTTFELHVMKEQVEGRRVAL